MVLAFVGSALFAPFIAPCDPFVADLGAGRLAPMGTAGHLLGTDGQGRDILSRLIWGGRVTITVALLPVVVSAALGLFLGLTAAMGGKVLGTSHHAVT